MPSGKSCYCGKPAGEGASSKEGPHLHRPFFNCAAGKCDFFQWADEMFPFVRRKQANNFAGASAQPRTHSNSTGASKSSRKVKVALGVEKVFPVTTFNVQCEQNAALLTFFHSLPGAVRGFNSQRKVWVFAFTEYQSFISRISSFDFVDLHPLPKFLIDGLTAASITLGNIEAQPAVNIPAKIAKALLPFQYEGVQFALRRQGRCLIGDEMGCGKTIQAIAIAYHFRKHWPVLVMAPASVRDNWKDEFLKWSDEVSPKDIQVMSTAKDVITNAQICIATYDVITKLTDKDSICVNHFGVVIADESHLIKNRDAKRTQSAVPLLKQAKVALCLSGTPATNRPVELFPQLQALRPEVFNDYQAFTERYCNAHQGRYGLDVSGCSNPDELKRLLEELVMIRRFKKDILAQRLPKKHRQLIYVDACPHVLTDISKLIEKRKVVEITLRDPSLDQSVVDELSRDLQVYTTKLYSLSGMAKITGVMNHLVKILSSEQADGDVSALPSECERHSVEEHSKGPSGDIDSFKTLNQPARTSSLDRLESEFSLIHHAVPPCQSLATNARRSPGEDTVANIEILLVDSDEDTVTQNLPDFRRLHKIHRKDGNICDNDNDATVPVKMATNDLVPVIEIDDDHHNEDKDFFSLLTPRNFVCPTVYAHSKLMERNPPVSDNREGCDSEDDIEGLGSEHVHPKADSIKCDSDSDVQISETGNKRPPSSASSKWEDTDDSDGDLFEAYKKRQKYLNENENSDDRHEELFTIDGMRQKKRGKVKRRKDCDDSDEDLILAGDTGKTKVGKGSNKPAAKKNTSAEWKSLFGGQSKSSDIKSDESLTKTRGKNKKIPALKTTKKKRKRSGSGLKVVVFAHHKEVMDALEIRLREMQIEFIRIDGHTPTNARHSLVTHFHEDEHIDVALLGVTACGTGINLTCASIALFAELYWTPGTVLQAEDRIHRMGQQAKSVRIMYLLAKGTTDDEIWSKIQRKLIVLESTLGQVENRSDGKKGMLLGPGSRQLPLDAAQTSLTPYLLPAVNRSTTSQSNVQQAELTIHVESFACKKLRENPPNPYVVKAYPGQDSMSHERELITATEEPCTSSHAPNSVKATPAVLLSNTSAAVSKQHPFTRTSSFVDGQGAHSGICRPCNNPPTNHVTVVLDPARTSAANAYTDAAILAVPAHSAQPRPLSPQTRARIEENKRRAIEKRAKALTLTSASENKESTRQTAFPHSQSHLVRSFIPNHTSVATPTSVAAVSQRQVEVVVASFRQSINSTKGTSID